MYLQVHLVLHCKVGWQQIQFPGYVWLGTFAKRNASFGQNLYLQPHFQRHVMYLCIACSGSVQWLPQISNSVWILCNDCVEHGTKNEENVKQIRSKTSIPVLPLLQKEGIDFWWQNNSKINRIKRSSFHLHVKIMENNLQNSPRFDNMLNANKYQTKQHKKSTIHALSTKEAWDRQMHRSYTREYKETKNTNKNTIS